MELTQLNLRNPIRVGYYDPFNIYPLIKDDLHAKFPLSNLQWKSGDSKVHAIPLLPVTLIEEVPKIGSVEDDTIYSRVMFVKFDSLDVYRSQVRPLIIEWLKNLVIRFNSEWTVVLYISLTSNYKPSTLVKHSAYDKLKIDFGIEGQLLIKLNYTSNKLRCFKIKENDSATLKSEAYSEIIQDLKSNLLATFSVKHKYLISNLSKSPIENFATELKLAEFFNDARLFQESLDIYDKLQRDVSTINQFSKQIVLPADYANYDFEKLIDTIDIKHLDQNSLFDMKSMIFINQSILLQSLSQSSKSLSNSAINISILFQKLIKFLNDLLVAFTNVDLKEFVIVISDYYLNLPAFLDLVESNNKNSQNPSYQLHEILEFRAELKLFQRSRILQIGQKFDYEITGIPVDIDLHEKELIKYTYPKLLHIFDSKDNFYLYFESFTESIIADFVKSGRSRTIDILTIDLALLNYDLGNYTEALSILQESYGFFIDQGWDYMGGFLLEMYLDCLNKVDVKDYKVLINTCLELFASIGNTKFLDIIGINTYGVAKDKSHLELLMKKVVEYSQNLTEILEFPLQAFFNINLSPYLHTDDNSYKQYVDIDLEFQSELYVDLQSLSLSMVDAETNERLEFSNSNVNFEEKTFRLYSSEYKFGKFGPRKLIISVNNNLRFVKIFDLISKDEKKTLIAEPFTEPIRDMHMYQSTKNFWGRFDHSSVIDLGETELNLLLYNGNLVIDDLLVTISSRNEGFTLSGEIDIKNKRLEAKETTSISIPYHNDSDIKIILLQADISFTVNGETLKHTISKEIDTTLVLSVSVQDTFRKNFIYSKFQIGAAIPHIPLRLLDTHLVSNNDNYTITRPRNLLDSIITYAEQPASIFFRITPKDGYKINADDCLDLDVYYLNLQEECEMHLIEHFKLKLGPFFANFKLLVKRLIVEFAKFDLINYSTNNTIKVVNLKELEDIVKDSLPLYIKPDKELSTLQEGIIKLIDNPIDVSDIEFSRNRLHISVPIPTLQYLLIVEFEFERKPQYLVGDPIPTKVKIYTTNRWALEEASSKKQCFQISLQDDDNWLYSGSKKQSYTINSKGESHLEFDLILIPLIVGKFILPRVTIQDIEGALQDFDVELNFLNALETLLVVPDLDSITFSF